MNIVACIKQILYPEIHPRDFQLDPTLKTAVQGTAPLVVNPCCFSAYAEVVRKLVVSLYQACATLNIQKTRPLQYKVRQLLPLLMQNYPAIIKYAMELMGRPVGQTRRPMLPLTSEAKVQVEETLKSLSVIDEEPRG